MFAHFVHTESGTYSARGDRIQLQSIVIIPYLLLFFAFAFKGFVFYVWLPSAGKMIRLKHESTVSESI